MQTIAGEMPIEHDESTRTYRLSYDWWCDQSVASAIVTAISAITDTPPTDMEPIHQVVDPDALNDLYSPRDDAELRRATGSTSFRFHDCDVVLSATGDIEIRPLDDHEAPTEENPTEGVATEGVATEGDATEKDTTGRDATEWPFG